MGGVVERNDERAIIFETCADEIWCGDSHARWCNRSRSQLPF